MKRHRYRGLGYSYEDKTLCGRVVISHVGPTAQDCKVCARVKPEPIVWTLPKKFQPKEKV